eukprot:9314115-Pyramimonas_sp.AAC.1
MSFLLPLPILPHPTTASSPFRHTPQTFRGTIRSAAESLHGAIRMWTSHPFRQTPHAFRGPVGSSTEGPNGEVHM